MCTQAHHIHTVITYAMAHMHIYIHTYMHAQVGMCSGAVVAATITPEAAADCAETNPSELRYLNACVNCLLYDRLSYT